MSASQEDADNLTKKIMDIINGNSDIPVDQFFAIKHQIEKIAKDAIDRKNVNRLKEVIDQGFPEDPDEIERKRRYEEDKRRVTREYFATRPIWEHVERDGKQVKTGHRLIPVDEHGKPY